MHHPLSVQEIRQLIQCEILVENEQSASRQDVSASFARLDMGICQCPLKKSETLVDKDQSASRQGLDASFARLGNLTKEGESLVQHYPSVLK